MKRHSVWLAFALLGAAMGVAEADCPNGTTTNIAADGKGNECVTPTPGPLSAAAQIGQGMALFSATTSNQPLSLTLPGKVRLKNPQYLIGTSTLNTTPLQVNYSGGNACSAPTDTLSPGEASTWVYIANTTQPTVCLPSGATSFSIEGQQ
jgi:hypothetical protein